MKTKMFLLTLQGLILSQLLFSCAKHSSTDLSQVTSTITDDQSESSSDDNADNSAEVDPLADVNLQSHVDDSSNKLSVNGSLAFDFDRLTGEFIIMLPMPSGLIFTPTGALFPNHPEIVFTPIYEASGKIKLAVRVPVSYVIKGINFANSSKLPNGDNLPMMPAGQNELPALALNIPINNTQLTLYIGVNALALYYTLPSKAAFPIPVNITLPIKNKDKTQTVGYLTYVNAKGSYPPGLFLSTIVPSKVARVLEDYFKL